MLSPEICGAPILGGFALGDFVISDSNYRALERALGIDGLLQGGDSAKIAAAFASLKSGYPRSRSQPALCSLPRCHKGPHFLLNPR